jgi:hypothetical protein
MEVVLVENLLAFKFFPVVIMRDFQRMLCASLEGFESVRKYKLRKDGGDLVTPVKLGGAVGKIEISNTLSALLLRNTV